MNYILGRDINFLSLFKNNEYVTFVVRNKHDFQSKVQNLKYVNVTTQEIFKFSNRDKIYLSIDNILIRKKLISKYNFKGIISKKSYVYNNVEIKKSTNIFQNCYIGPNVSIGLNCKINNNVSINHDTVIGNNVVIGPGVVINGKVIIQDNVYIGSNCTVLNNVKIAKDVFIGAHTLVSKSLKQKGLYYGVPARFRKKI